MSCAFTMARSELSSEAGRGDVSNSREKYFPGKRRAEGQRVELMRRAKREYVPDSCGGAGGTMEERIRKKEVRSRSNGLGERLQVDDTIWSYDIPYANNCFA